MFEDSKGFTTVSGMYSEEAINLLILLFHLHSHIKLISGAAMSPQQDPKAAFKAEWEALQMYQHQFAL